MLLTGYHVSYSPCNVCAIPNLIPKAQVTYVSYNNRIKHYTLCFHFSLSMKLRTMAYEICHGIIARYTVEVCSLKPKFKTYQRAIKIHINTFNAMNINYE